MVDDPGCEFDGTVELFVKYKGMMYLDSIAVDLLAGE
jgi:hypothetical protein